MDPQGAVLLADRAVDLLDLGGEHRGVAGLRQIREGVDLLLPLLKRLAPQPRLPRRLLEGRRGDEVRMPLGRGLHVHERLRPTFGKQGALAGHVVVETLKQRGDVALTARHRYRQASCFDPQPRLRHAGEPAAHAHAHFPRRLGSLLDPDGERLRGGDLVGKLLGLDPVASVLDSLGELLEFRDRLGRRLK